MKEFVKSYTPQVALIGV